MIDKDIYFNACYKIRDIFLELENLEDLYTFHTLDQEDERVDEPYQKIFEELCDNYDIEWIDNGLTKMVISFRDIPYVVKIPFLHVKRYDSELNVVAEYEYEEAEKKMRVGSLGRANDYCKLESDLFIQAAGYGLDGLFAETWLAFTIDDKYPIYISEKIANNSFEQDINESTYSKKIRKSEENISSKHKVRYDPSKKIRLKICADYGEKILDNFLQFIDIFDIDDLHDNNVGLRDNGKLVIFDYSGYNEKYFF